jgi:hypothetical protein
LKPQPARTEKRCSSPKGCAGCHTGKLELAPRLRGKTLTGIAAEMWNHAPKMAQLPPKLEKGEMRQIVSLSLDSSDSAGQRQPCRWEEGLRGEELRHLPQRSFERRSQSVQPPGNFLHHHHDLYFMASRPADVEGHGREETPLAEVYSSADV